MRYNQKFRQPSSFNIRDESESLVNDYQKGKHDRANRRQLKFIKKTRYDYDTDDSDYDS
jgi:hypothetical protein